MLEKRASSSGFRRMRTIRLSFPQSVSVTDPLSVIEAIVMTNYQVSVYTGTSTRSNVHARTQLNFTLHDFCISSKNSWSACDENQDSFGTTI